MRLSIVKTRTKEMCIWFIVFGVEEEDLGGF